MFIVGITDKCRVIEIVDEDMLLELQEAVHGYIEVVPLTKHFVLVVNEDGALTDLPVNEKASDLFGFIIHGNAVILGNNLKPLNKDVAKIIAMYCNCDRKTQKNIYEEVLKNGVTL